MELYFVLAIMAFMIFGFMLNKWPFGLTTMICCILLVVTGVYNVGEAFSGFSSQNIILVAPMFAMSAAFSKTSLLTKIQAKMLSMKGKSGTLMLIAFYAFIAVLAAFLPTTAMMLTCLMFLTALDDSGDITPTTMTIPALAMLSVWGGKLPFGMGATAYVTNNAFYEGMVTDQGQLLQFLDFFKVSIIPCLLCTVYCLFGYKLMPKKAAFDASKAQGKKQKEKEQLPQFQENMIYIMFVLVLIALLFGSKLGQLMYIIPAIAIVVLIFAKSMSVKEVVTAMTGDPVFMIAGVLVMADALGDTGAGELIGQFILNILGGNPSGLMVLFVFAIVTTVMTTFMSNSATKNVLLPIAASTCIAAGWDPRGVVLIVAFCSNVAIAFPSGSPACGIAYTTGGYKNVETLRFTLPFIAIAIVSIVLSANFFFPVYG